MLYIDAKYASMLQPRLRNFKQQKDYLWNFSCPVCGDSKKNKLKARAYIYRTKNDLFCKCHNCGYSASLGNLIKFIDERLYDEYTLERYESTSKGHISHKKPASLDIFKQDSGLEIPEISDLTDSLLDSLLDIKENKYVYQYVKDRLIPDAALDRLRWTPHFKQWVNENVEANKFQSPIENDHPRLIIPFVNVHGKVIAIAGRAFGKEEPKYYTIKIDEDAPKIFGMDQYNTRERGYVVEGPIDSLFLPNSIAVAGSTLDVPDVWAMKSNLTLVPDNEPRNKEIVKQIKKYVDKGYTVCLWPDTPGKDINEMILNGMDPARVVDLINENSYTGLEAEARFSEWRKC